MDYSSRKRVSKINRRTRTMIAGRERVPMKKTFALHWHSQMTRAICWDSQEERSRSESVVESTGLQDVGQEAGRRGVLGSRNNKKAPGSKSGSL